VTRSLPPLELEYTEAVLSDEVHTLDQASMENLPAGIGTSGYEFVDLDGDSTHGILTTQTVPGTTNPRWVTRDTVRCRRCRPTPRYRWRTGATSSCIWPGTGATTDARRQPLGDRAA
jgi:hypothetical protein